MMKMYCISCGNQLHETDNDLLTNTFNLREEYYGCDSGCMIVKLEVDCDCGYSGSAWQFGEFYDGTGEEREKYLADLKEALRQGDD